MARKSEINKKDLLNLYEISDEEFARITDNLYSQKIDYKSLPNLVLLPNVKEELRNELNIRGNLYITKNRLLHTNPIRKNAHKNQGFTKDEYKAIPDTIRKATYALKETESEYNSFLITTLDKNDSTKANCIIFDEDKNGNLLTTIKKVPLLSLRNRTYEIVGTGVEPAISNALREPSTTLTTSPNDQNLTTKEDFVKTQAYANIKKRNVALEEKSMFKESREILFSEQVDLVLAGKYNRFNALKVCDTPQIFLDAGLKQLPILYTQNHLKDALHEKSKENSHWHGLSVENVKQIPEHLKNPAFLLDSLSEINSDSIIAVLGSVDNDNAPIFAAIKPNGHGTYNFEKIDSNFMMSVYGKDNGFSEYIERAIKENKVLYWNKEKSQALFSVLQLQLPQGLNNLDSNKILHQTNSVVNTNYQIISGRRAEELDHSKERNVALEETNIKGDKIMPEKENELYVSEEQALRIQLAREIKQNMPNLSDGERAAALAILEAGAASMQMSLTNYVQQTFPNGVFGDYDKAQNAAHQQGVEINGAVSVSGFGKNVRAVIYASRTADFSTWCHELSHIWQAQLTGTLKDDAEKAFQVQDGNWQESIYTFADGHTDTSAEAFAYGFEDFLKHKAGEMATEDKKAIFEKFADYMSRTYNGIKQNIEVSEEIAKVYEQFVQLDDNILAEAEKAVQMEIEQEQKINEIFNSPNFKTSQKVSATIGLVSDKFADLASQYGYDIKGYSHTIDNFFVNHALKQHGDKESEERRGNIAITHSDIRNVFSVYSHPDYIIFGTKTKTGNPAIVYVKNIGNSTIFVEDVRSGKKELAAQTLYKKFGTIDVSSKKEAPELYAHSDPESVSIVDVKKEFVNEIENGELIFQAAYHGSGVSFDRFNTAQYGLSGEGSMSFGWGTYLTSSEDIARDYAQRQVKLRFHSVVEESIWQIMNASNIDDVEEAKKVFKNGRDLSATSLWDLKNVTQQSIEEVVNKVRNNRNLYSVEIPDGKYLQWNKNLSNNEKESLSQSLKANNIHIGLNGINGRNLYLSISGALGSDKAASEFLKESGYTGISYPAGTINGNGNDATNYVIFNDDDITIKEHLQFQLVGERSIMRMAQNEERKRILEELAAAKLMDEKYSNIEPSLKATRIRFATGWEKSADGQWKYELDDSLNRIKSGSLFEKILSTSPEMLEQLTKNTTLTLDDIMEAPELYSVFPFMKNVRVGFYSDPNAFRAVLTPDGIKINTKYLDGISGEKGMKGVLAHEIQHIIQAVEYSGSAGINGESIEQLYNNMMEAMKAASIKRYDYDVSSLEHGLSEYMHDSGEIEARNVARRIFMNASERRHTTLESTEDIARNMQFQIIGEQGARELDRNTESNVRIANLDTAKKMEEAAKDAKAIRLATGWEKGVDGKWKYEIDDSKVHFNLYDAMEEWAELHPRYEELREKFFKTGLSEEEQKEFDQWIDERNEVSDKHTDMDFSEKLFGKTFKLPEVMRHNELFKAYPELKDVTVSIQRTGESGTLGNASYEDKHINLYRPEKDIGSFEEWEKKAGSILLHEVQHIIQGIEGFAKGSNPKMFEETPEASELSKALASYRSYTKEQLQNFSVNQEKQNYRDLGMTDAQIAELSKDVEGLGTVEEIIERGVKEHGAEWMYNEIQYAVKEVDKAGKIVVDGKSFMSNMEAYMVSAGEVESRNVQARMKFTPEQRRNTLLSATADFAPEDQIVIFDGLTSESRTAEADERNVALEETDKKEYSSGSITASIKSALVEKAEPLVAIDFTLENYDRLFPFGIVQTPIEKVKLGENQFEKLDANNRSRFLLATYQTLATPDIVIDENRNGSHSHNYIKSFIFDEKTKAVQDIVVSIDGENVSITAHPRDINNIVNKIKTPDQLVYAAAEVGRMIDQRVQNELGIVNPTRVDRLSTISVPLNKEYSRETALSTIKEISEKTIFFKERNVARNESIANLDTAKEREKAGRNEKEYQEWISMSSSDEKQSVVQEDVSKETGKDYEELKQPLSSLTVEDYHKKWDGITTSDEQSETLHALRVALDDYFENGKRPVNDRFIVGKTPLVLQKTGSDLTEVTVPVSVVKKAVETHGLSQKEVYETLAHIYNPILIFDSDKKATENKVESKLVLTDIFKDEKPLALAVNVNDTVQNQENGHRKQIEVQNIRSIHDRNVVAKNGTDLIQKWANDGLCRYVDDKKITDWSTIARVYFPIEVLQSDNNKILTKSELVNRHRQNDISEQEKSTEKQTLPPYVKTLNSLIDQAVKEEKISVGKTQDGETKQKKQTPPNLTKKAASDFLRAVQEGTAPFFSMQNDDFGKITMTPQLIVNAQTGLPFKDEAQLLAQIYSAEQDMNGQIVTSMEGAKEAGTYIKKCDEAMKNFVLVNQQHLSGENKVIPTRYFSPEAAENPDMVYANVLHKNRPAKIKSFRKLCLHFERLPEGQKDIQTILTKIAWEHLKEIQRELKLPDGWKTENLKEKDILEKKEYIKNYFEKVPVRERTVFQETFGICTDVKKEYGDPAFSDKTRKIMDDKLTQFIKDNSFSAEYLAAFTKEEYDKLEDWKKEKGRQNKIEAVGIKEPEVYLGRYLAACNSHAEFITDAETIKVIKEKLSTKLKQNYRLEKYDILKEIGMQAGNICKETMKQNVFSKAHSHDKKQELSVQKDKQHPPVGMGASK